MITPELTHLDKELQEVATRIGEIKEQIVAASPDDRAALRHDLVDARAQQLNLNNRYKQVQANLPPADNASDRGKTKMHFGRLI